MRWRTPVAAFAILAYLLIYVLAVMWIGQFMTGRPIWLQVPFYVIAGFIWIFPTVFLFRWSAKDPGTELSNLTIEERAKTLSRDEE